MKERDTDSISGGLVLEMQHVLLVQGQDLGTISQASPELCSAGANRLH